MNIDDDDDDAGDLNSKDADDVFHTDDDTAIISFKTATG